VFGDVGSGIGLHGRYDVFRILLVCYDRQERRRCKRLEDPLKRLQPDRALRICTGRFNDEPQLYTFLIVMVTTCAPFPLYRFSIWRK